MVKYSFKECIDLLHDMLKHEDDYNFDVFKDVYKNLQIYTNYKIGDEK